MRIVQTGMYVPQRVITNDHFVSELQLQTTADWIEDKTGIVERRYAAPHQHTSDLAVFAAREAVQRPGTLDLIIVATTTPDMLIPSTATIVQRGIEATCPAVDLNNACAGFIYALDMAYHYLAMKTCRKILVIGADVASRLINTRDRITAPFFADGAGAVLVERGGPGHVLGRYLAAEGDVEAISTDRNGLLTMDGLAIWKFALRVLPDTVRRLADQADMPVSDIDWIIPHQSNGQMIKACMAELAYPQERLIINVNKYGNTVSATIPMALHEGIRDGRIKSGDTVALVGYGAGLAWGGMLLRY